MKNVSIFQEVLIGGINTVNRAVSQRVVIPILSNILLKFTKKNLTLFATDLEFGIETVVPCEQSEAFETTIPAKIFSELIATMPGQLIHLEYNEDNDTLTIKGAHSTHNIKCIPSNDYPKPSTEKFKEAFILDTTVFKSSISRILFAASEEDNKPVLSSVIFSVEKGQIIIYALDGFRASLRTIPVEEQVAIPDKIIIPSLVVSEAAKIALGPNVSFGFTQTTVVMKSGKTTIYGQIVDGKAPDHKLIEVLVSGIKDCSVVVNTAELSLLCKQADIFASKNDTQNILLETDLTGISVIGNANQIGDSNGHANATVTGAAVKISLSSAYLREFLEASKSPSVTINMADSKRPVVIRITELPGYWHMIMPVNL